MAMKGFLRTLSVALSLAFALCCLPGAALTQTFRGTILGRVTDNTGAVIPGTDVSVRNTETGLERSTVTDSVGNFSIPARSA